MVRDVVKIDEDLCNGCGVCIPSCHEGALQIIDGKARLISDLMCDGLGACLNHCPEGAMTIEKREAEAYDEIKVMSLMVDKGINTVVAHMKHLKEHEEFEFLKQAVAYLKENDGKLGFSADDVIRQVHKPKVSVMAQQGHAGGGCPGSQARTISRPDDLTTASAATGEAPSELRQWPVQMHLVNPAAPYFRNSDMVLAADCVPFAMGNFHSKYLKGRSVGIACPKLDSNQDNYIQKLVSMIDDSQLNTLTVTIMEVPCCGGLLQTAKAAVAQAKRKIPLKLAIVSLDGKVIREEWI